MGIKGFVGSLFEKEKKADYRGIVIENGDIENISIEKKNGKQQNNKSKLVDCEPKKAMDITYIYMTCSHMCMNDCYTFTVTKNKEKITLDSWYYGNDGLGMRFELSNQPVEERDFKELLDLFRESFFLLPPEENPDSDEIESRNSTEYILELGFSDGISYRHKHLGDMEQVLHERLVALSDRYMRG